MILCYVFWHKQQPQMISEHLKALQHQWPNWGTLGNRLYWREIERENEKRYRASRILDQVPVTPKFRKVNPHPKPVP